MTEQRWKTENGLASAYIRCLFGQIRAEVSRYYFSVCSINGYQLVHLAVRPVVASLLCTFIFHLLHSLIVLLLHILQINEKPVVI